MERKSGAEPGPVNTFRKNSTTARLGIVLLCILMLLPWVVVGLGLYVLQDYRLTMLGYGLICCLLPVLLFRQKPVRFLPLRVEYWPLAGLVVLMSFVLLGIFYMARFGIEPANFHSLAARIHLELSRQAIKYGVYFIVMNPLLEEVFWRGFIYEEWKRWLSPTQAALVSSFFFGAWHWMIVQMFCPAPWAVFLTLIIMAGGYIMARLYEETGSLVAPVLLHSLGADIPLLYIVLMLLKTGV
jgi:membrane protease YdiL (CAAX protease family)